MTDDNDRLPFLPAEWRRSAEAIAHAMGFEPPARASEAEWDVILCNVKEAARLRGIIDPPVGWQEALARKFGRGQQGGE